MANSHPAIFDRLAGLETEYALRFHTSGAVPPLTKFELYRALVDALRRSVPAAEARHFKEGLFLANGGAVWFEAERPAAGGGLIEGSTPECRGPRQLVCHQRAQDRLLAEAAAAAEVPGQLRLIKNDRDSCGNVYGAQENYETIVARGVRLWLWRFGLVALLPLVALTWLGLLLLISLLIGYLALAALLYAPLRLIAGQRRRLAELLFGRDLAQGRETGGPAPAWLESCALTATRIVSAPLALALLALTRVTAFHEIRRRLLPLLISRSVVCGAGMLDQQGGFWLADKAPAVNCVVGLGGFLRDRPLFTVGHLFKALCVDSLLSPRAYCDLFAVRQRLQIGLGDSNMAESAELLRTGMTMLVLDVIEAGQLPELPPLRRPIRALHAVCRDPLLQAKIEFRRGTSLTALELQRFYYEACRRFVEDQAAAPAETREVLGLWSRALEGLQQYQSSGRIPLELIGVVDWATKRHLLCEAGAGATWEEQKKIDIRYHELSVEGYHRLLEKVQAAPRLIDEADVVRAMRNPPSDSPATMRGHYIREFGQGEEPLAVNWSSVVIGRSWGAKVVRLARYGRRAAGTVTAPLRGRP